MPTSARLELVPFTNSNIKRTFLEFVGHLLAIDNEAGNIKKNKKEHEVPKSSFYLEFVGHLLAVDGEAESACGSVDATANHKARGGSLG